MNALREYNTYIAGMEKSLDDKLFFLYLPWFNLENFDTIIDFGCGSGDVLVSVHDYCVNNYTRSFKFIGIDKDDYMRALTKSKLKDDVDVYDHLDVSMFTDHTLIIFNSVLHEINGYWTTLKNILKQTCATVVVRDMRMCNPHGADPIDKKDLSKLVKFSNPNMLSEFIAKYGMNDAKSMYHYLLKYAYVDNWDLELKEDYFSFNWESLERLGTQIYASAFHLTFKENKVKSHFGIDMTCATHYKMILKINDNPYWRKNK